MAKLELIKEGSISLQVMRQIEKMIADGYKLEVIQKLFPKIVIIYGGS